MVIACGGADSRKAADSAAAIAAAAKTSADPRSTCPPSATWTPCNVHERLEQSGLVPVLADTVHHEFMRVPGVVWRIERSW